MSDQAIPDSVIAEVAADTKVTVNGHNTDSVLSTTQEVPEEDEQSNENNDTKPKKGAKSTFVITSVTYNTESGPNQEDGEDRENGEDEEDESLLNDSAQSDSNQINNPNATTTIPSSETVKKGDKSDSGSRFKVVKVPPKLSEPYIIYRHRWKVTDYLTAETEPSRGTDFITNRVTGTDSTNSSRASSVHYTPGLDDPNKNPLVQPSLPTIAQSTDSNPLKDESSQPSNDNGSINQPEQSNKQLGNNEASTNGPVSSTATSTVVANQSATDQVTNGDSMTASTQPTTQVTGEPSTDPGWNDDTSTTAAAGDIISKVPGSSESQPASPEVNDLGAALEEIVDTPATPAGDSENVGESDVTPSGVAIDNKIEQAMDLVKSHLMLAVREEVEELRLQIKQLVEKNAQLEQENQILRSSASPDILAHLSALGHSTNS